MDLRPRSVDFLDMTVWIDENGKFQTDLYTKETDRITSSLLKPSGPYYNKHAIFSGTKAAEDLLQTSGLFEEERGVLREPED